LLARQRRPHPAQHRSDAGDQLAWAKRLGDVIVGAGLKLDLRTRRLSSAHRSADLSQREFALTEYLMRRVGSVCSRTELLSEVWGYGFDPGSNVVDVTIARLRAKLADVNIDTIRNVGYVLRGT